MLQKIKKFFNAKSWGGSYTLLLSNLWNSMDYNTQWKYDRYAWLGYMSNPVVYRAINITADAVAGIPWKLYRKDSDNKDIEIEKSPILDLIRRPNPWMGSKDFFALYVQYLQLSGNVYIRSVGPNSGVPKELYFLRPDRIEIKNGDCGIDCPDEFDGLIYEYLCGANRERIDLRNFYHGKNWNPLCDFYGMSILQPASSSIDQLNESLQWNTSLLKNSASPSGILSSDGNLSDEQISRLKEELDIKFQGVWNSGRPFVTEGGLKYTPVGLSPREMDFIEGTKMAMNNICVVLGVDPSLMGSGEHRNFATFKEAQKSFYMDTVLPLCDKIRDYLNFWLLPRFPNTSDMYFTYDMDQIEALSENQNAIYDRVALALDKGIITVNEAREALGYSELKQDEMEKPEDEVPVDDEDEEEGFQEEDDFPDAKKKVSRLLIYAKKKPRPPMLDY